MPLWIADTPEAEAALRGVEARRNESNANALRVADDAIAGVRARGDAYVSEQIARFDKAAIAPDEILITPREVKISSEMAEAIDTAIDRVDAFHRAQLPESYRWTVNGTVQVRPSNRATPSQVATQTSPRRSTVIPNVSLLGSPSRVV